MVWITVLFGLLSLLLQWLLSRKTLGPREQKRLNGLIYRCREVEDAAVKLGCKPGGDADDCADEATRHNEEGET